LKWIGIRIQSPNDGMIDVMKKRITTRDIEQLSAYLDGQLSSRERSQLESRIQQNPDLSEALEQLRRTRAVLRSLPTMRAPRNFTLSPQAVPARPAPMFSFNLMRSVSVVATLLLIVVFVSDFLQTRQLTPLPAMEKVAQPPIATLTTEAVEAQRSIAPEAAQMEAMEVLTETAEVAMPYTSTITEPIVGAKAIPSESEQPLEQAQPTFPEETATPSEVTLFAPVVTESYPLPQATLSVELPPEELPSPADTAQKRENLYRLLEGLLAFVAVVTGIAALVLSKRKTNDR
jgi:anti-sigma-K factor RskA